MGLVYSEKWEGYIADTPNIDFERCDGTVFSYDKVNTASSNFTLNGQDITGGQYRLPLAHIDTDSTIEISFESSAFTLDIFELANAEHIEEADIGTLESKRYEVATGLTITLPFEVAANSVFVRGLEEASAAASGKFAVAITAAAAETAGSTVITFHADDAEVGQTIRIAYRRRVVKAQRVVVKNTSTTAKGALYLHFPVYSSGSDCTESAIKAWLHIHFYRVRVTQVPGINASFKTAQTFGLTFNVIDPQRADGRLYEWDYEPLDSDGNMVTKSEVAAADIDWGKDGTGN